MKYIAFLGACLLGFACGASAQLSPANALLFTSPEPAAFAVAMPPADPAAMPQPAEPQGVYGVFQNYNFQAYIGYTFLRFYEVPNQTDNLNGLNFSIVYYPHEGRIAADGEFVAVFGSHPGASAKLAVGMGGARFRWTGSNDKEFWVHALAGGAHFLPQTAYGGQGAFAYELGGGIDIMPHRSRFGYRLQADAVGTLFFGTYQMNPKVSVGIVYKF
jgi:hypothetical protein